MSFIESQFEIYVPPPIGVSGAVSFAVAVSANFTPRIRSPHIRASVSFNVAAKAEFRARTRTERGVLFRIKASAKFNPQTKLVLTMPEPMLPTSASFRNGFLTARLFQNGVSIPLKSFSVSAPKDKLSKSISVQVAAFDRNLINPAGAFKFQLGHKANRSEAWVWFTIVDGARLQSKNFDVRFPGDSVSFVASAEDNERLQTAPSSPQSVYDPRKIQLSNSEESKIYTENGNVITTQLISISNLNLYKLLKFAFVDGCGFSSVETDLPNYEISRCDFPMTATYLEGVLNFARLYNARIRVSGDTLVIQRKTTVPADFAPAQITPASYSTYSENLSGRADVDGIQLDYQESSAETSIQTTRTEYSAEETGTYGYTDYTRTEIVRAIREYKQAANPSVITKSEILSETRSTYDFLLVLIARETETHTLDRQGKRKKTSKTSEGLVPNLASAGSLSLLKIREETVSIFYKPDPRNVRRSLQNRTVTQIHGLIAIDGENPYFDKPFKQDFGEAHKAGNLKDGMTSDFGPVKTITESLQSLGNGQTNVLVQTVDHLRNTLTNSISETRAGESAISGDGASSRRMVIYKSGYTKRKKLASLSVGELPLIFALPLAKLELDKITNGETNASIEISGFNENLDRGTYLDVLNRDGMSLGVNLTEGYTIEGSELGTPRQRITTRIEAALIKRDA